MIPADIALADEIVAELNSEDRSWSMFFRAERTWWPDFSLKTETPDLLCAVQPSPNPTIELLDRNEVFELWPMTLVFAKRLTAKTRDEIDSLRLLVDAVRTYLQTLGFTLSDGREFVSMNRLDFYQTFDPELLDREKREDGTVLYTGEFLSWFTVPYRYVGDADG